MSSNENIQESNGPQVALQSSQNSADEREYGPQPLADVLAKHNLTNHQIVEASTEQLTHKMLGKACRGRFISMKIRLKIQRAVNTLAKTEYRLRDLFNY